MCNNFGDKKFNYSCEKLTKIWYVSVQHPTETNKTLRNHKREVHSKFKIETPDLPDVGEISAWISKHIDSNLMISVKMTNWM